MRLPNQYVEIEQEDMMYLEGGIAAYVNWWGISISLSKGECFALSTAGNSISALISIYAGYTGLKFSPHGALTIAALWAASTVASIGANGRGMWININWLGGVWPSF